MESSSSRYSVVPKFIRDRMREKKRREQDKALEEARRTPDQPESRYSDEDRKALEEMSGDGFAKGGMVGCGTKKYAKGGMVKKYADGGMVTPPAGMARSGRLPVAGPPPNAPPMTPNIARMPPPDQTMPMPASPPGRPIAQPGPGAGPRPGPMVKPAPMRGGQIMDQGQPMPMAGPRRGPSPNLGTMGGPGGGRPPRGFKDGGLVSKVKPPGGRGTKSCKIC